jgi:hypothetical protein
MPSLREILGSGEKRARLIDDSLQVAEAEVNDKSGLSGIAIKTAYKVVKGVSPGFLRQAVDHMLDQFLDALDPMYQEAITRGVSPRQHLQSNPDRAADALLSITDDRAKHAKNQLVKGAYDKLRGSAKKHVVSAMPRLGELFERHTGS